MSNRPTHFVEANALLYVQRGDYDAARDCLREMSSRELHDLEVAASDLIDLIKEIQVASQPGVPHEPS